MILRASKSRILTGFPLSPTSCITNLRTRSVTEVGYTSQWPIEHTVTNLSNLRGVFPGRPIETFGKNFQNF